MRAGRRNLQVVRNDNGEFCAITLGSDFCAEHEWGIDGIKKALGINPDSDKVGIERRRISKSDKILFVQNKQYSLLLCSDMLHWLEEDGLNPEVLNDRIEKRTSIFHSDSLQPKRDYSSRGTPIHPEWKYSAAWSEKSFGILASTPKLGEEMRWLHEAFESKDIAIFIGARQFIENGSLTVAIISRVSDEAKQAMKESDEDHDRLMDTHERIGIQKRLDNLNEKYQKENPGSDWWDKPFGYYALSPRWASEKDKKSTKYPIIYWLNPRNQEENHFGWVTVEDLEDWIKGKGKIPGNGFRKEEEKRAKASKK